MGLRERLARVEARRRMVAGGAHASLLQGRSEAEAWAIIRQALLGPGYEDYSDAEAAAIIRRMQRGPASGHKAAARP